MIKVFDVNPELMTEAQIEEFIQELKKTIDKIKGSEGTIYVDFKDPPQTNKEDIFVMNREFIEKLYKTLLSSAELIEYLYYNMS